MHENIRRNTIRYFAWLPAIFVAAAIFFFSAQPADLSTEVSDGVTTVLLKGAEIVGLMEISPKRMQELCELLATPVRKTAHVMEYMILHGTVLFALYYGNAGMRGKRWLKWAYLLTVFYACTDEFHQLFVPGRAGMILDVIIDSIGVSIVTWILFLVRNRLYSGEKEDRWTR